MGPTYGAYQLAEIEFRSGHVKAATQQFERLAKGHPNSEYANNALERALLLSTEFTGESPAEPKFIEALGLGGSRGAGTGRAHPEDDLLAGSGRTARG